jgi:3-deoxy-D-manno-octulosonic-acid transferase
MRIGLLHSAYSVVVTCVLPIAAVGLLLSKRGRRRMPERFGLWGGLSDVSWWVHGASVGEVQGLLPLLDSVRRGFPGEKILLSATSPTGLDRGVAAVDSTRLLPFDSPLMLSRAIRKLGFKRFVLSETELWPNALRSALMTGAPCHIVNGRISDYTFSWYKRLQSVFCPLLREFTSISVPDSEQRDRFLALGVAPERVHVTGHTKYDAAPRFLAGISREQLRQEFFPGIVKDERVITLGSIREGEESYWLTALQRAVSEGLSVRIIVAPRHAEKFDFFDRAFSKLSVPQRRWSSRHAGSDANVKVLILDTMGVLEKAYAASDLAFVGATLVDIGGHNPFEPVMYGVPVVVGPYTSVIREPVALLVQAGGICSAQTAEQLYELVQELVVNPDRLQQIGRAGHAVWQRHQGAVQRTLSVIRQSEALQ